MPTPQDELKVVCDQIAWLERYLYDLDCISPQALPEHYERTMNIMNSTAPHFFLMLRGLLLREIYLSISRLLDKPVQSSGKNQKMNMSMERLICSLASDREKPLKRLEHAKALFEPGRDARNTVFAHLDYHTVCSEDISVLTAMELPPNTLNTIVLELRRMVEDIADSNPLPTVLPKNDAQWLGVKTLILRLEGCPPV